MPDHIMFFFFFGYVRGLKVQSITLDFDRTWGLSKLGTWHLSKLRLSACIGGKNDYTSFKLYYSVDNL